MPSNCNAGPEGVAAQFWETLAWVISPPVVTHVMIVAFVTAVGVGVASFTFRKIKP
jgi:hypothetical protein